MKEPGFPNPSRHTIIRANLFSEVTGLICRLPLSTLSAQSEFVKLRDLLRI